jgi:hypothetical protein
MSNVAPRGWQRLQMPLLLQQNGLLNAAASVVTHFYDQ